MEGTFATIHNNYQPYITKEYDLIEIKNLANFHYIYYFILQFKRKNAFYIKGR